MSKKGTARWSGGAAIVLMVALAVAGCGGGGSDAHEEASRKKLLAGAAKLTAAKSFEASVAIELEEEGETQELGCIDLGVENGKPAAFDMRVYDLNCAGGTEGTELIAVGDRAWAATEAGDFTAAKIDPKLLHQVDGEQTDLRKLFTQAEGIEVDPEGAATEEGESNFVDVPAYSFRAPASAFPQSDQAGAEDVEFEAVLDRKGYLRELILFGTGDAEGATVTEKYEDIDADLGIGPPDPSQIHGHGGTIRSRQDLDELLGVS